MTDIEIRDESPHASATTSGSGDPWAETGRTAAEERYDDLEEAASEKMDRISEEWPAATEKARQTAREAGYHARTAGAKVYRAVSENLLPTIVTGVGIAWLTAGVLKDRTDAGQRMTSEYARRAQEARSRVQDKTRKAGEKAKDMGQRVRDRTRRTKDKSKEVVTENTFLIAAALAGVGVFLGLALPESRRERRLFSEMRDEIQQQAQEMTEEEEPRGPGQGEAG
jgi:ElaB/YqjD/DUF883 family membrane-anchored ribosome-binding protein